MMDQVQIEREGEIRYSRPIARALLRDPRISWGAKGLFAFLWDCPRNWKPNIAHLAKMGPDGHDATRSRLKELEKVEAMQRKPLFGGDGKLMGSRWIMRAPNLWAHESLLTGAEERVFRPSAKPGGRASPTLGSPPPKVNQSKVSTTKEEEERSGVDVVDKLRGLGVVIQNTEDVENGRRLVSDIGGRFDLIRNAVAVVRSRKEKNRPFVSSVARAALCLLGDERYQDAREKCTSTVSSLQNER